MGRVCARVTVGPQHLLSVRDATRRDASRKEEERERRGVPVTFQVGQGRWHEKGEMGREKRRKRVGARRVEEGRDRRGAQQDNRVALTSHPAPPVVARRGSGGTRKSAEQMPCL